MTASARVGKIEARSTDLQSADQIADTPPASGYDATRVRQHLVRDHYLASQGMVTGPYRKRLTGEERDQEALDKMQDAPRNALRIGDHWIQLGFLGPHGMVLGLGAAIYYGHREGGPLTAGAKSIQSIGQMALDLPLLSGTQQALGFLDAEVDVPTYLGRTAASFMPAGSLLAATSRGTDPVRDRMVKGFLPAIQERIPGQRQALPPRPLLFGDEPQGPGLARALLDPSRARETSDDPLIASLVKDGIPVRQSMRKPGESDAAYSARVEAEGRAIREVISKFIRSARFERASPAKRDSLLQERVAEVRSKLTQKRNRTTSGWSP